MAVMRKILTTFLLYLSMSLPASGMPPNEWIPEDEALRRDSWLQGIHQKIKKQKQLDDLTKAVGHKRIYCRFRVDIKGKITDLIIVGGSGDAMVDDLAINLIRSVSPLPPPPDNLASRKAFVVSFSDLPQTPEVTIAPFQSWAPGRFI